MEEKTFIKKITALLKQAPEIKVGPGDDCAAIDLKTPDGRFFLTAADQLAENIHYDPKQSSPAQAARKLLKRNISDIAAMGGIPKYAILTISANYSEQEFLQFFKAIEDECEKWSVSLCGGDISASASGAALSSLTINGWVEKEKLCLRSGASPGDILFATGFFGASFPTNHHMDFEPRLKQARFLAGDYTNTMIDVSDGFLTDALQLAEASGLGLQIDTESIPLRKGALLQNALTDGEDYELLFAASPEKAAELEKKWQFKDAPLSKVGVFTEKHPGLAYDASQCNLCEKFGKGFDHFSGKND